MSIIIIFVVFIIYFDLIYKNEFLILFIWFIWKLLILFKFLF